MYSAIHTPSHEAYLTREVLILELSEIDVTLAAMQERRNELEQALSNMTAELPSVINWADGCLTNVDTCLASNEVVSLDMVSLCVDSVYYILNEYSTSLISKGNDVVKCRADIATHRALRNSIVRASDAVIDKIFYR